MTLFPCFISEWLLADR